MRSAFVVVVIVAVNLAACGGDGSGRRRGAQPCAIRLAH